MTTTFTSDPRGARRWRLGSLLALPALLIVAVGLLAPLAWLFYTSLLESLGFGQLSTSASIEQYRNIWSTPLYRDVILNALTIGAIAALTCLVIGYPVAYFLAFHAGRHRDVLLLIIVCSMFSSYLARVFAWRTILGSNGVINYALEKLGFIDSPLKVLLFNDFAVVLTWANLFLPLVILLLTASMLNVDVALLESARDLGAGPFRGFLRVALPLTMPSAVAAFTYVLILAAGDYVTPVLVGGKSGLMVGQVINDQFVTIGDQPQGAALSVTMMLIFAVVYGVASQLQRLTFRWA